ncbi:MAG: hypothetical protein ABI834_01910, partial [Ginsengibacter sp.]
NEAHEKYNGYLKIKSIIMNKINLRTVVFFMFIIAVSFSSCAAIGGIFKAGVWVGIIAVVVVVAVIFWLVNKAGKK